MSAAPYHQNVTLITGASSGIGAALAYELAAQGAWLALGARRLDELEIVAEKCRMLGGRALAIQCDVSEQKQCEAFVQQAAAEYGRVHTLVNNAGITMWARFADLENPDLIERIMKVNFLGAMYCTYYALPYLKKTLGRIACISSMADKIIAPGNTGYVASKHAMEGFFEALRPELVSDGVSVTMLYLGFVDTGFAGRMLDAKGDSSGGIAEQLKDAQQMSPEASAKLIADATYRRKRQVLQPVRGLPGWTLPWIKLIAPGLLERVGRQFMESSGL
ncbi:MAG: SDR family oxidoreductase [Chloroflexota bacterium]